MRNGATFIASLALLAACSRDDGGGRKESDWLPSYDPGRSRRGKADPGVRFVEVDCVDFVHVNGATKQKYLPETMGSGVALFDHDNDGDLDLLFVQSRHWDDRKDQPTMRLYRNDGAWKFTDVTEETGLAVACYGMGATVADYDADGDLDVYVTCLGRNLLFRNEGGRRFTQVDGPAGGSWGGSNHSWSTGAAWFDADGDGDLDLLVVSYVRWTREMNVPATLDGEEKAYTRPQLYEGDAPRLYLQQPDGSFAERSIDVEVPGKSMAVCLDDFNGDGRTDIFVANDTVQNYLFLGRGGGRYEEVAVAAAVAYDDTGQARAGMGVDTADLKNSGTLSIAIGNFSEEPLSLYTVSRATKSAVLFQDDANTARIGHATLLPLTFGLLMTDVDLDGWCDLILANGHIEPTITKLKRELRYAQPPQYFRNLEGRRFADVSRGAGAAFSRPIVGRGLAAGDLDGDGDLDLVLTSNGGKPRVLRCDLSTRNRFLRLRLKQPGTRNLDALGAVVKMTAGGMTQRRVVRTGGSYLSQGELTLTFGLGAATKAEKVSVRWPDGAAQEFGPRAAGRHTLERK